VGRWCPVDNEAMASGKDSRPFLDERGRRLFIRNAPTRVTNLSAQSSVVTTRNHFREPRFWGGIRRLRSRVRTGHVEFVVPLLVDEIRATHPVHVCFSFKVGATPHKTAMRSMELMMSEVRPRIERALGALTRNAAD
jgi:hypothetical protein